MSGKRGIKNQMKGESLKDALLVYFYSIEFNPGVKKF